MNNFQVLLIDIICTTWFAIDDERIPTSRFETNSLSKTLCKQLCPFFGNDGHAGMGALDLSQNHHAEQLIYLRVRGNVAKFSRCILAVVESIRTIADIL